MRRDFSPLIKYSKKIIIGFLFIFLFMFFPLSKTYAFSCSSNGSGGGNFNVASTWTGCNSTTPQAADSITINSGDTVTLVATTTVKGITINNGGIFAANTRTLTNTDFYTNNGSHTSTTSTMTLSGPSGTVISGNGSYSATSGVMAITSADKTIAPSSQLSIPNITVTGVILTNNSTVGLSVTTALSGTGTLLQGTSSILKIGGTSTISTLTATASPNEVHYTSTTAGQTVKSTTYHNFFIDKSGQTGTLGGVITINGNMLVTAGTFADGGNQITGNATGTVTLAAGSTLTLGLAAAATSFPTAFTTFSIATTSTVNYNSTSAQTISNVPTYGNLTLTGASVTKTAAGALTVNGNLTNTTSTAILADGGFTITVKGNSTMTGTHTGGGKILFTGGVGAHSVVGVGSYNNVELNDANGVTQTGTTNIGGTLTITAGTWTVGANTIAVTGTTFISGTIVITSTTGTKTFGDITIANGGTLNFTAAETLAENGNLTIASGGTMSFTAAAAIINLAANLTVSGTGVITGATGLWTFSKAGGGTIGGTATSLTISGSVTFATQYTISYPFTVNNFTVNTGITQTNTSTITVNGTLGGAGTFTQNSGTALSVRSISITTLNATALGNIVHFIGGVSGTIKGTSYVDMDINKTTGFTATANGTVNVGGNLTVTSGTISFASSIFTVTGTTDIYGTLTDSSGGAAGGNNVFNGLVAIHSGAIWLGIIGEVCDFHFGNGLIMDGASFTSSTGIYYFESNNQSITGSSSFTIDNLSVAGIQLTNSSTGTLTVGNALSGSGNFIQDTNSVLNITGTSTITTFTASATGNSVNYNGAAAQTVHAGIYRTLTLDSNTSGSVNITADTTANTLLALGATKFSTSTNKIILGNSSSIARTSGYVIGTIEKNFNSSTSFTYDIGDISNYTPIDLTLTGVTGGGSIDASVINTDSPDIANSGINSSQSVNRYWTLINNGVTFGSYNIVLNFVSGDIDSGANVSDMTIAKNTAGSWGILPASCTGTSCNGVNLTSMSDFQIGVPTPNPSPTPGPGPSSSVSTISSAIAAAVPAAAAAISQALLVPEAIAPAALFDIVSSPLFPDTGSTTKVLPVVVSTFSIGSFCGFGFIILSRRRRKTTRESRILRIARRRQRGII